MSTLNRVYCFERLRRAGVRTRPRSPSPALPIRMPLGLSLEFGLVSVHFADSDFAPDPYGLSGTRFWKPPELGPGTRSASRAWTAERLHCLGRRGIAGRPARQGDQHIGADVARQADRRGGFNGQLPIMPRPAFLIEPGALSLISSE